MNRFSGLLAVILFLGALAPCLYAGTGSRVIAATEWTFNPTPISPFTAIRATPNGSEWLLKPNASSPNNCFGFLEGPSMSVDPATDGLAGNKAGFLVVYKTNPAIGGEMPELRLRLNSADFGQYSVGGVATARFRQINAAGGTGLAEVEFDRTLIETTTNFRLYIDLVSAGSAQPVNPNWEVRIVSAEWFVTTSNSSFSRDDLFNLVYMDESRDAWGYIGGSRSRVRIHDGSGANSWLCYDGAFAVVIDGGVLYTYTPLDGLQGHYVWSSAGIVAAALSDQHVGYLDGNGRANYYNIITGERKTIDGSNFYAGVTSAGDGTLIFVQTNSDGTRRIFQYDTRRSAPQLERVYNDYYVKFLTERSTGYVPLSKSADAPKGFIDLHAGEH